MDELDNVLHDLVTGVNGDHEVEAGSKSERLIYEAKAKIQRLILTARYRELVDLGKLYNGSKVKYFIHYEERHKYLTRELEK